jgi:hypothetical protein
MNEWEEGKGGKGGRGMEEAGTVLYINTYIFYLEAKAKRTKKERLSEGSSDCSRTILFFREKEKGLVVNEWRRLVGW